MKRNFLLPLVLFGFVTMQAQNLVPNGGFDLHTDCPTDASQYNFTPPWFNPTNHNGTPDYMHPCATNSKQRTPQNFYGHQEPVSDSGYYGLITYQFGSVCREYMSVQLTSPMIAGSTYLASVYVSAADNFKYATDHFGIYFSVNPVVGNGTLNALTSCIPQIDRGSGNAITDTVNWTLISGSYTASGGEQYLTIGNFYSDANTTLVVINPDGLKWGYYYVDEVSVTGSTSIAGSGPKDLALIYPTRFDEVLNVRLPEYKKSTHVEIFNPLGAKVMEQQITSAITTMDTKGLSSGIYFIRIEDSIYKVVKP